MNYIICDDDPNMRHQIEKLILSYYSIKGYSHPEITLFESGDDLIKYKGPVDIAYIDVEMKGISGLNAAKKLKETNPNMLILVVTSYNEYLDEAFEYKSYRFIQKPINKEYFFKNLKSAIKNHETRTAQIALQTRDETSVIYMADIIFVEKVSRKVIIHTINGNIYPTYSINELEKLLVPGFYRIHKTCIVNFRYISKFDHYTISFANSEYKAYIPRRVYSDFKKSFLTYMESTGQC